MTGKTPFKRARNAEQIEQRRRDILQAAAFLMQKDGFDKVSLNAIARRTGLAKSNIYRYFESKEEIFLQLLTDDWVAWIDDIEIQLRPYQGSNEIEPVVKVLASSLVANSRMCELISVLTAVLENNLSEEALIKFKTDSIGLQMRLLASLGSVLSAIPQDTLLKVGQSIFAMIGGMWPLTHPNAVCQKVMNRPELTALKMEFETCLESAMRLIFKGAYAN